MSARHRFYEVVLATAMLFAGWHLNAQWVVPEAAAQAPAMSLWRSSLDGRAYAVRVSDTAVTITPAVTAQLSATMAIKTDKKRRTKVMGQWQAGQYIGFIALQQISDDRISGYMLVPVDGVAPNSCLSRTMAFLSNLANSNQTPLSCQMVAVSWVRQPGLTFEQASQVERAVAAGGASQQSAGNNIDSGVVGKWHMLSNGGGNSKEIWLTLNPDGTYEKIIDAHLLTMGHIASTQNGTWSGNGNVVQLRRSEDGEVGTENLSRYSRSW